MIVNGNVVGIIEFAIRGLIGVAVNGAAGYGAFALGAVTTSGAIAGAVLGTGVLVAGGLDAWLLLATFFVTSTGLGRVKRGLKVSAAEIHEKGNTRDHVQVFANGGAGLLFAVVFAFTGSFVFLMGCAIAFAAANADTWASEIGVLSAHDPVNIVTLRPIRRGASGGVTILGSLASLCGAAVIAAVFAFGYSIREGFSPHAVFVFSLVTGGGVLGSLIDSVLGATVQAQYRDADGALTEKPSTGFTPNTLIRGRRLITNDAVNALASISAALLVILFFGAVL